MFSQKSTLGRSFHPIFLASLMILLATEGLLTLVFSAGAESELLKDHIIKYNLELHRKFLAEDLYRGEEGILMLRPEVARELGLSVPDYESYVKGRELYEKADAYFEKAVKAMTARKGERFPGEYVRKVGQFALAYNESRVAAKAYMMNYRSELDREKDERLDASLCARLLNKLLKESLQDTGYNLRDALARFYNRCHGLGGEGGELTVENVHFVNYLFRQFALNRGAEAEDRISQKFDLDKQKRDKGAEARSRWKDALEKRAARLVPFLEPLFEGPNKSGGWVDPLLFVALIKQESNFNERDVSSAGAVGLTQIMPGTGIGLGMENIFRPKYLDDARSFVLCERSSRQRAVDLIPKMNESNKKEMAARARRLMQESQRCKERHKALYGRYKREIAQKGADDRLDPAKSVQFGFEYFSEMMALQDGDMSLALASYNAGPHRVRQYDGIPPYRETIDFRNKVLRYYRAYLKELQVFERALSDSSH